MVADRGSAEPAERFRRLFDAYFQPLMAYARRRCDDALADDVVSETFLVAWRRIEDVPGDSPLPWLYGIARRTLANQRRGRERQGRLINRLAALPAPRQGGDHENQVVLDALGSLSVADQEVLKLGAWEGLTVAEIAVVLGCSTNAAALRLSRARRRLRQRLTVPDASRTQEDRRRSDA